MKKSTDDDAKGKRDDAKSQAMNDSPDDQPEAGINPKREPSDQTQTINDNPDDHE